MRRQLQRKNELGIYLAGLRQELNETVTSLADKAQISPSSLSDIELGKRKARPETLRKLSGPLGIDPNQLFIRAYLTQELRPTLVISSVQEELVTFNLRVTREERQRLEEYLEFLRFRRIMNPMDQFS